MPRKKVPKMKLEVPLEDMDAGPEGALKERILARYLGSKTVRSLSALSKRFAAVALEPLIEAAANPKEKTENRIKAADTLLKYASMGEEGQSLSPASFAATLPLSERLAAFYQSAS